MITSLRSLREKFNEPVNSSSIVFVRISFGLLLVMFTLAHIYKNWMERFFVGNTHSFYYWGFSWIEPLPGPWMYLLLLMMGISSLLIALGLFYRWAVALFFLIEGYFFLCEPTYYQNHIYLILLITFLIFWMPLNKRFSLDEYLGRVELKETVPYWCLWILQFQVGTVYLFGALTKTNSDWMRCQPLWSYFQDISHYPLINPYLIHPVSIMLISYGVLAFEYLIVPLLVWSKTQYLAFGMATVFHGLNKVFWGLDVFPYLAIILTTVFLPPDWPEKLGIVPHSSSPSSRENDIVSGLTVLLIGIFCFLQIMMPLRHYFYEGPVGWNNWGKKFSWRMKGYTKKTTRPIFVASIPDYSRTISIPAERYLKYNSTEIGSSPILIWQYAQELARKFRKKTFNNVEIYAHVMTEFNGRPAQYLVDPTVDLSRKRIGWHKPDWIRPVRNPIRTQNNCLYRSRNILEKTFL